jgi:hypothetical protein
LGWKVTVLIAALHLLLPVLTLSPGTNDTTRPVVMLWLIVIVLALGTSGLVLFIADPPFNVAAGAFLVLGSAAALRLYGYAYNDGWFDLQRKPDDRRAVQQ